MAFEAEAKSSTHYLAGKHIIVAGAGIAGLAFVASLSRNWPEGVQRPRITVYDRDPEQLPVDRGNYSLGLRSDKRSGGLQALQKLGMIEDIYDSRAPGSDDGIMIRDAKWTVLFTKSSSSTPPDGLPIDKMRITRNNLRECLNRGVSKDVEMRWGTCCNTAAQLKGGGVEVGLSDGTTEECDLFIVADGASSRVRGCLRPDDGLRFAGAVMVGGNADFADRDMPRELQEGVGVTLGGEGHSLIIFRLKETENKFVWFLTQRAPSPRTTYKGAEAERRKDEITAEVLREGEVFGEPLRALVAVTDPASLKTFNAQDKPPISHTHISELPCIYIGDANHAMR